MSSATLTKHQLKPFSVPNLYLKRFIQENPRYQKFLNKKLVQKTNFTLSYSFRALLLQFVVLIYYKMYGALLGYMIVLNMALYSFIISPVISGLTFLTLMFGFPAVFYQLYDYKLDAICEKYFRLYRYKHKYQKGAGGDSLTSLFEEYFQNRNKKLISKIIAFPLFLFDSIGRMLTILMGMFFSAEKYSDTYNLSLRRLMHKRYFEYKSPKTFFTVENIFGNGIVFARVILVWLACVVFLIAYPSSFYLGNIKMDPTTEKAVQEMQEKNRIRIEQQRDTIKNLFRTFSGSVPSGK